MSQPESNENPTVSLDDLPWHEHVVRLILRHEPPSMDVWNLAVSLQINVILQLDKEGLLSQFQPTLGHSLTVLDQITRSANPRVAMEALGVRLKGE